VGRFEGSVVGGLLSHDDVPERKRLCPFREKSYCTATFESYRQLLAHCRRSLANYKVPRRVEFFDTDLPKSSSGKILKRVLRERFWEHQERAVS